MLQYYRRHLPTWMVGCHKKWCHSAGLHIWCSFHAANENPWIYKSDVQFTAHFVTMRTSFFQKESGRTFRTYTVSYDHKRKREHRCCHWFFHLADLAPYFDHSWSNVGHLHAGFPFLHVIFQHHNGVQHSTRCKFRISAKFGVFAEKQRCCWFKARQSLSRPS